jgi:hypothetical protein
VEYAIATVKIVAVTATCPSAADAIDGNLTTGWACGPQKGGESFVADLGTVVDRVSAIRYTMGASYREFPRALSVETSIDSRTWEPAREGDVIAATIEGALQDPLTAPATIAFPPRRARYVRLTQTGKDDLNWVLPELEVLAGR